LLTLAQVGELKLNGLLIPADIAVDTKGRIYAADGGDKNVKIFDTAGKLLKTVGGGGQGPGEFKRPTSIALTKTLFAIGDINKRVSLFSLNGEFKHFFWVPGVVHLGSSLRFIGDTLLVIGGGRQTGTWEGYFLHLHGINGTVLRSFFSLSETAKRMRSISVAGARFDIDSQGFIYAVQPTEYTISVFNTAGDSITQMKVAPRYFRALRKPEPTTGGPVALNAWSKEWDILLRIFVVNDSLLAVSVGRGGGSEFSIDFIHKTNGKFLQSITTNESLIYVDSAKQILYLVAPPTEEPLTVLRLYKPIIGRSVTNQRKRRL
jgi:DNA-binding beta-propeller fold protein YncE